MHINAFRCDSCHNINEIENVEQQHLGWTTMGDDLHLCGTCSHRLYQILTLRWLDELKSGKVPSTLLAFIEQMETGFGLPLFLDESTDLA